MEPGRQFTRKEIEGWNTIQRAVIIIDNEVYDVTEFLEDHPGGARVLLDNAGGDATQCFRAVGHSEDALARRRLLHVGTLVLEDRWPEPESSPSAGPTDSPSLASLLDVWAPPLLLAALATLLYLYLF